MPRTSRKKSERGYYHVILRGVNRQDIFYDDKDKTKMLDTFQRYLDETDVTLNAYCLMSNHVHLLVNTMGGPELFVKKIASSYVFYFNHKYDRVGHLFQDRYISETIETDTYLLTVFRYILQNPMKAGICTPAAYPWSSWKSMEGKHHFCDIRLVEAVAGGRQALKDYVLAKNEDQCLEAETIEIISEAEALRRAVRITGDENPLRIALYSKEKRNQTIVQMKKAGLSVRKISRLTGISRNIIQRAK